MKYCCRKILHVLTQTTRARQLKTDICFNTYFIAGIFESTNGGVIKNLQSRALSTSSYFLTNKLLGVEQWINQSNVCTFPEPWRVDNDTSTAWTELSVPRQDLDKFVGVYGNHYIPSMDVQRDPSSSYRLKLRSGILEGFLHTTQDSWRFLLEIRKPVEFAMLLLDNDNQTVKSNVTFEMKEGFATRLYFNTGVNLTYTRDVDITDAIINRTNGCWILSSALQTFVLALSVLIFQLTYQAHTCI